jgi:hypothetical protein
MTANIKSFFASLAIMAVLFTVACTKDTLDTVVDDASIVAVNELVTLSEPPSGPPPPDSVRLPRDSSGHGHGWGRGHGNHPSKVAGDSIGFSGLPAAARTYVLANFDTSKIKKIIKITLADGTIQYSVRFNDHTHAHFDAAGVFISTTTDTHRFVTITLADLPAAAQTFLNANTTAANIVAIIKVTKPDGTFEYGVRLADNTRFTFNAAGAVIANPKGGRHGKH